MIHRRKTVPGFMAAILACCFLLALSGCGSGGPSQAPAPSSAVAAAIGTGPVVLMVDNPQLNSDGATPVTLTALVRDSNNVAKSNQTVSFSSSSGALTVVSGTTDTNGQAKATLGTGFDPTNRTITVNAVSGGVTATNTVQVVNTSIDINGLTSVSFNTTTVLTITLKDSSNKGIANQLITVTSAKGNTLAAPTYTTNGSGQISVTVTGKVGGVDTLTASALGATKTFSLTVNNDLLAFTAPAASQEININTNQNVTVNFSSGGVAVAGATVNFAATRGALSSQTAITNALGNATVTVSSSQSGPSVLSASTTHPITNAVSSNQVSVEFVAPTPNKITLQVDPAVIGTNSGGATTEKSLISAVVRDVNDNLVKGKTVLFQIVTDASGGYLSPGSAVTDSAGKATTYFIGGASPGGNATIRATVSGTAITATTTVTVAKQALFINLGTGQGVMTPDGMRYQKDYVALVTDGVGNPVVGATVTAKVRPVYYRKGYYVWQGPPVNVWSPVDTLLTANATMPSVPACTNEDAILQKPLYDYNGVLDTDSVTGAEEDVNGNGRLDPGNVASVTATPTDATGHSVISIVYAKTFARWVTVRLEAWASLGGSTSDASTTFALPILGTDLTNEFITPPGHPSPFGTSNTCYADLTVTALDSNTMSLSWTQSPQAASYNVYRDGAFVKNVVNANATSDAGLAAGTRYCYQIKTLDAANVEKTLTAVYCGTTVASSITAATPTGLTVNAASSTQMNLAWTALAGATGYDVYRDNVYLKSVTVIAAGDSGLTANTNYCYSVKAYDGAGNRSNASTQVCATTHIAAPPVPTGVAATPIAATQINVAWAASAGAAGYNIYRTTGVGGAATLLSSTAPAISDTTVVTKTQYCYRVTAFDVSGNESAQSAQVCTATP